MWNTEHDFKKSEEAIKALDKADKRQADMRKLRGQKEPKEVIKTEPADPVNRIKPDFRRDKDRKYPSTDRKSLACYGCGDPFSKEHPKTCKEKEHTCAYCNKKCHFESLCWVKQRAGYKTKKPQTKEVKRIVCCSNMSVSSSDNKPPSPMQFTRSSSDDKNFAINRIQRIQNVAANKSCIKLKIELNKVKFKAVLDTGSPSL